MSGQYPHAIFPGCIPTGYFSNENIEFVRDKIRRVLLNSYRQSVNIDRASVIRVMQRILEERSEPVPRMNQRVVMSICSEVRRHQEDLNNHLRWEAHYVESQRLFDPTTGRGAVNPSEIKLSNRLGKPRVGGTLNFFFT